MKYSNIETAVFIDRPNRFIANVETKNGIEISHVKNTGRLAELLRPGATVYVERNNNKNRKTALDIIAVKKDDKIVNIDSQVTNKVVCEWLRQGNLCSENAIIKSEKKYGNSRLDVYIEDGDEKIFIEVKGVTLENDGIVKFPDAKTIRGLKHINELIECKIEGYRAYIFFVIQLEGAKMFIPNYEAHAEFGEALKKAKSMGVDIIAYDCKVSEDSISINEQVRVHL